MWKIATRYLCEDDCCQGLFCPFGRSIEYQMHSLEERTRTGREPDALAGVIQDFLQKVAIPITRLVGA